jgi:hypothetical protein
LRWLGISDLIAEPEGHPSSLVQLRAADNSRGARDTLPRRSINRRKQVSGHSIE